MQNDNPISADVAGDFQFDDYAIDPADAALAAEISNFDPLATPGPVTFTGNVPVPDHVPVTALPPHLSAPIVAAINADPANAKAIESRMVAEALGQNSMALRVNGGVGSEANAYQRECFAIIRDQQALEQEFLDLSTKLVEVDHWRPEFDAACQPVINRETGQQNVKAYEVVQGEARRQMEGRQREIENRLKALETMEGPRRRAKALKEAVEAKKAFEQGVADHLEAARLADEIVRNERVQRMAEARAKARRSDTNL